MTSLAFQLHVKS